MFRFRRALPLPVRREMASAGFDDAFRVVHPNPVASPGITWSPLFRGSPEEPGTADRIDRLYVRDPENGATLYPASAFTLPQVYEDGATPQADRVFPSDHAAVVVDLVWR